MSKVERLLFFDDDAPSADPIDGLLDRLGVRDIKTKVGCRVLRNPETGKMLAVFPSVPVFPGKSDEAKARRKVLADTWEKRSLLMHSQQVPIPKLEAKPTEIVLKYTDIQTRRGD